MARLDRPEVFDALYRITEGLHPDAQDHTKAIANHDLSKVIHYISDLECVMDKIQDIGIVYDVSDGSGTYVEELKPWAMFDQVREERDDADQVSAADS